MGDFISLEEATRKNIMATINGLSDIASARLDAWVRYALSEDANEFAEYVKDTRLSGSSSLEKGSFKQPIRRITGELYGSVKAWTSKATGKRARTLYVRPGVGIQGSLNYLARWCGTPLEFMKPSFREFSRGQRILKDVEKNVSMMLDKASKEMDN